MKTPRCLALLAVLLAGGLFFGCDDGVSTGATASAVSEINLMPNMGMITYAPPEEPVASLSREAIRDQLQTKASIGERLHNTMDGVAADEWAEADRRARTFLESLDGAFEREVGEQLVAAAMLRVWLLPGEDTADLREATARYTEMLIHRRSPEAMTIVKGVEKTGNHWDAATRAALAQRATEAARTYVERFVTCDGCTQSPRMARIDNRTAYQNETVAALHRLQELAAE